MTLGILKSPTFYIVWNKMLVIFFNDPISVIFYCPAVVKKMVLGVDLMVPVSSLPVPGDSQV